MDKHLEQTSYVIELSTDGGKTWKETKRTSNVVQAQSLTSRWRREAAEAKKAHQWMYRWFTVKAKIHESWHLMP